MATDWEDGAHDTSPCDVVVLETASLAEVEIARNLLAAHGIPSTLVGEEAARLGPLRSMFRWIGGEAPLARIAVRASDAPVAKELLRPESGEPSAGDG